MSVTKTIFGKAKDGSDVILYTLENASGMQVKISSLGAAIVSILIEDKNGRVRDVVLGYDSPEGYYTDSCHFGKVIGRNGNRIDQACFTLNGRTYQLTANDNENNLHSGNDYFGVRQWTEESVSENSVKLSLHDDDLRQGFPGSYDCAVTYTLTADNGLCLHYEAACDQDTVSNLTNHVYFNLNGHDSGSTADILLKLPGQYTPVRDGKAIPTGQVAPTAGTPMDFTAAKAIGLEADADFEQLKFVGGYDHNYVICADKGQFREFARAYSPSTGIRMTCFTDLPGVQFYGGNFIPDGLAGKDGVSYSRRSGFCLETQYYPNAVNQEGFASPILKAGEKCDTTTEYRFAITDQSLL